MTRLVWLLLLAACSTDPSRPPGDVSGGDPGDAASSGDPMVGDPLSGDPLSGDPLSGDPGGDPLSSGDPLSGDPVAGDPTGDSGPTGVFLHRQGTKLELDSLPFQTIAMNKVDLFWQFLGEASGTTADVTRPQAIQSMADAAAHGICCFRVAAVGFYPANMETWESAPDDHWAAFDDMLEQVELHGLRVIPVIWWNQWTFADMVGAPLHDTYVSRTTAHDLLMTYTTELVSRYRDRESILFWELTNEINLLADLDMGLRPDSGVAVSRGTPAARTSADNFSSDEMAALMQELATLTHTLDPNHLVSAGYSSPRPSAWHLRNSPEWDGPDWTHDNASELNQYVALTNPDPIDLVSVHHYGGDNRFGIPGAPDPDQLSYFVDAADAAGKPLFLGEFGDTNPTVSEAREANFTRRVMLKTLELKVPLALIWTWEFYQFAPDQPSPHSIEPGVDDDLIAAYEQITGWLEAATPTPGSPLAVGNGGFEDDTNSNQIPDAWETVWRNGSSTGYSATRYCNASDVFLGNCALRLDNGAGDAGSHVYALSDAIAVTGGETLVISAALRHHLSSSESAAFSLIEYDATGSELGVTTMSQPTMAGWRLKIYARRVTLSSQARSVRVRFGVGGGENVLMDVDDVRLSRID